MKGVGNGCGVSIRLRRVGVGRSAEPRVVIEGTLDDGDLAALTPRVVARASPTGAVARVFELEGIRCRRRTWRSVLVGIEKRRSRRRP